MSNDSEGVGCNNIRANDKPNAAVHAVIRGIWSCVLGVTPSDEDTFLTLGGSSLLAEQVASRIRTLFDVELPMDVVLFGTVGEIAVQVGASVRPPA